MSGTSLDGIDLAVCNFEVTNGLWDFKFGAAETIPYSEEWQLKLKEAIHFSKDKLIRLNEAYTQLLTEVISSFLNRHHIAGLDAICSHGHTIIHQPAEGITLQIGNLPSLAKKVKQTVVCDFRLQDVAFGGQGAPLVPIGDRLLFREYDCCLNLGGFANLSFEKDGIRMAYDICPVNIVLNLYAQKLGHPFDRGGAIAASGKVLPELLETLNRLHYYSESPPKSLGLEWVQTHIFPVLEQTNASAQDLLCTFTEHVAVQLAAQIPENTMVLVTGGGVYNTYLLERLKSIKPLKIEIPPSQLIEYKEALIFGLLGVLRLRNEVNCLASVTGARENHSSGNIFHP